MIKLEEARKAKRQFLLFVIIPWFLTFLIKWHLQESYIFPAIVGKQPLLSLIVLSLTILMMVFTIRFALKLGIGVIGSIFWGLLILVFALIPICYLLLYLYPRETGIKLTFFLGDKGKRTVDTSGLEETKNDR